MKADSSSCRRQLKRELADRWMLNYLETKAMIDDADAGLDDRYKTSALDFGRPPQGRPFPSRPPLVENYKEKCSKEQIYRTKA